MRKKTHFLIGFLLLNTLEREMMIYANVYNVLLQVLSDDEFRSKSNDEFNLRCAFTK